MDRITARLAEKMSDVFPVRENEDYRAYLRRANEQPSAAIRAMAFGIARQAAAEAEAEHAAAKSAWIAAARLGFSPGSREPCRVCGKYQSVTEAHHVVPLSAQYDRGFIMPDHEHVWLCPTHHAILHLVLPPDRDRGDPMALGRRAAGPICDLAREEIAIILNLLAMAGRYP